MTVDMNEIKFLIGKKLKIPVEPVKAPPTPTFGQHFSIFCIRKMSWSKVTFDQLLDLLFEFILQKGTNLLLLRILNPKLFIYSKNNKLMSNFRFSKFAHCFNGSIKKSLMPYADKMLETSKRIHGDKNMTKYLNFYHVKYCKTLTDKERIYLEEKYKISSSKKRF